MISIQFNSGLQIHFYKFMDKFERIQYKMVNLFRNVYHLDIDL